MNKKYIVNLKDIAKATGVSIATVSRVLKGKGELAPATRKKVLKVANELGYRSNALIEGIKTGKTKTLGVMLDTRELYLNKIVQGVNEALTERNYVMMLSWPMTGVSDELSQIHRLMEHRVEGLIIRSPQDGADNSYFAEVIDSGVPIVVIDRHLHNSELSFVGSDDVSGAVKATEYLIAKGHRVIGHIQGPQYTSTGFDRRQGFENTIRDSKATGVVSSFETFGDNEIEPSKEFLLANPEMTAVFVANDLAATGLYRAARELGVAIPEHLSVVAFSDTQADQMIPKLTSMSQKPREIGKRAVELIFELFEDEEPREIKVEPVLVERESVRDISS